MILMPSAFLFSPRGGACTYFGRGRRAREEAQLLCRTRTGGCSAMTLAAARMAIEDAGLGPDELRGRRTAVVMGTTMGEAQVLEALGRHWIHQGEARIPRALIPKYGSTLLPIHVARAV